MQTSALLVVVQAAQFDEQAAHVHVVVTASVSLNPVLQPSQVATPVAEQVEHPVAVQTTHAAPFFVY